MHLLPFDVSTFARSLIQNPCRSLHFVASGSDLPLLRERGGFRAPSFAGLKLFQYLEHWRLALGVSRDSRKDSGVVHYSWTLRGDFLDLAEVQGSVQAVRASCNVPFPRIGKSCGTAWQALMFGNCC